MKYEININGDNFMPHKLYKDEDGTIKVVVEADTVTISDIDKEIVEVTESLAALKFMREEYLKLEGKSDVEPVNPITDQPMPPVVDPTATATPANGDLGQVPANASVDAPAAPTAAVNNGQSDPAAASNPQPAVDTASVPAVTTDGNPQPVINN